MIGLPPYEDVGDPVQVRGVEKSGHVRAGKTEHVDVVDDPGPHVARALDDQDVRAALLDVVQAVRDERAIRLLPRPLEARDAALPEPKLMPSCRRAVLEVVGDLHGVAAEVLEHAQLGEEVERQVLGLSQVVEREREAPFSWRTLRGEEVRRLDPILSLQGDEHVLLRAPGETVEEDAAVVTLGDVEARGVVVVSGAGDVGAGGALATDGVTEPADELVETHGASPTWGADCLRSCGRLESSVAGSSSPERRRPFLASGCQPTRGTRCPCSWALWPLSTGRGSPYSWALWPLSTAEPSSHGF